jgi:hypothetical protein
MKIDPKLIEQATASGLVTLSTPVNVAELGLQLKVPPGSASYSPKSEQTFQCDVIDLARSLGWRVAHFRRVCVMRRDGSFFWETPVAANGKGFPDLELVRERLVKVELKIGKNKATAEQKEWLRAYSNAGVEWYVWRPVDWPIIVETLTKKVKP